MEPRKLSLYGPQTHRHIVTHASPLLPLCKSNVVKINTIDHLEGQKKISDKRASLKGGKKSPTSFPLLQVVEEGKAYSVCTGYYNVIRRLVLCGSLASPEDNSKRSSKDILSGGRISKGITLNDSPPLDLCKKLITFHMQIGTPQV